MKRQVFCALLGIVSLFSGLAAGVMAGTSDSLLSDDPGNAKWHLEPQAKTIVFIGNDSHPTRIALSRNQLAGLQLTVDSDSNKFSIMSGFITINGQWTGGKKTLTLNAVGDSPSLLVSGNEIPALKGRWTAIAVSNADHQVLLEFPDATYANLSYEFVAGADSSERTAPVTAHLSVDQLKAQLADAQTELDTTKSNLLARLGTEADYKELAQRLDQANKAMQAANQDGESEEIASAATKQMDAQVAVDRMVQKFEAADPQFQKTLAKVKELQRELVAYGPLTGRKSWNVTVVGKPPVDVDAMEREINLQQQTLRQLGPTETPPSAGVDYYSRGVAHQHVLTPSEEDAIAATNTRNAQRQTAQRKLDELQHELAQMEDARLVTGTLEDGTGVSIFANGSSNAFADSMQVGGKYTVKGSASMIGDVLRINLASAVPCTSTLTRPLTDTQPQQ